jgi:hypothetical protein
VFWKESLWYAVQYLVICWSSGPVEETCGEKLCMCVFSITSVVYIFVNKSKWILLQIYALKLYCETYNVIIISGNVLFRVF